MNIIMHHLRISRMISLARFASARPELSLITSPTIRAAAFSLPFRTFSATSGTATMAASHVARRSSEEVGERFSVVRMSEKEDEDWFGAMSIRWRMMALPVVPASSLVTAEHLPRVLTIIGAILDRSHQVPHHCCRHDLWRPHLIRLMQLTEQFMCNPKPLLTFILILETALTSSTLSSRSSGPLARPPHSTSTLALHTHLSQQASPHPAWAGRTASPIDPPSPKASRVLTVSAYPGIPDSLSALFER